MDTDLAPAGNSSQLPPTPPQPQFQSIVDELLPPENPQLRPVVAAILLALALVSFFLVGPWASSPDTYAATIASLDQKRDTVMSLVTGSTGTSAAITALPGDLGTPIAEKLLDIGADFAIVIGAICLEKYLITTLGFVAFRILVPVGCVLLALGMLLRSRPLLQGVATTLGVRLAVFGIAIFLVIPASTFISDRIDETFQASVATAQEQADAAAAEAEAAAAEAEAAETSQREGLGGFVDNVVSTVTSIPETVSETASKVSQDAQDTLNRFIETLAVMIVSSCVIPILVLLFFMWLASTILGIHIDTQRLRDARMLMGRRPR